MSDRLSHTQAFLAVSSVVVLSRLPFLNTTLGTDTDVYRVALTALKISNAGEYQFSRFPGFPVQEYVFSWFFGMPAIFFNMITALISGICAGMFVLVLRRLRLDNSMLLGFALAFTPVVFVNSTTSLDYVWALACIMASLWMVFEKPWLAGVLFGLAVGCRFTSLLMIVPVCVLLWKLFPSSPRKATLQFIGSTFLTTCFLFAPVFLSYEPRPTPQIPVQTDVLTFLYKGTVGVWGIPGLLVLAGLGIALFAAPVRKGTATTAGDHKKHSGILVASLSGIIIYLVVFMKYPYEAGYLVPTVPLVLLILGIYMNRTQAFVLTAGLLLSSFTFGAVSINQPEPFLPSPLHAMLPVGQRVLAVDVLKGPVWLERERGEHRRRFLDRLYLYADTVSRRTVVVVGWLSPQIRFEIGGGNERSSVLFAYALRADAIEFHKKNGYPIRYLRGMNEMNRGRYGVDLMEAGALPLLFD